MNKMRAQVLILVILLIPQVCDKAEAKGLLRVAFLDIGQGDAIYIEAPNGNQMIIDGGPGSNILGPLSDAAPFGDRSVNVLMVTNPDSDHYAGFLDVLDRYDVGAVIEPGTHTPTPTHAKLEAKIAEGHIPEILARRGMRIDLDAASGVRFDVLFPDRDVSAWATNDGSIMGMLSYGKTRIMFTGDATKLSEGILLSESAEGELTSDILKVGHHGSATSSSDAFIAAVHPKYAVISSGAGNSYGLPKQVTLDTLSRHGIQILRTDKLGTITFTSDGEELSQAR